MDWSIRFPHLGIYLEHVGKNFTVFGISIAYYGVIIAVGMLAGILLATYEAKRTGQNPDDYFDLAIIAIICSVIGARLYYVIFSWDLYKDNLWSILNLRQGGLAIYGGVIAAIITAVVFAKVKGLSFPRLADTAGLGLILGQIIGRWGNFFNREAFGGYTDGLLAMQLPVSAVRDSDISHSGTSDVFVRIPVESGIAGDPIADQKEEEVRGRDFSAVLSRIWDRTGMD